MGGAIPPLWNSAKFFSLCFLISRQSHGVTIVFPPLFSSGGNSFPPPHTRHQCPLQRLHQHKLYDHAADKRKQQRQNNHYQTAPNHTAAHHVDMQEILNDHMKRRPVDQQNRKAATVDQILGNPELPLLNRKAFCARIGGRKTASWSAPCYRHMRHTSHAKRRCSR